MQSCFCFCVTSQLPVVLSLHGFVFFILAGHLISTVLPHLSWNSGPFATCPLTVLADVEHLGIVRWLELQQQARRVLDGQRAAVFQHRSTVARTHGWALAASLRPEGRKFGKGEGEETLG